jgi:RNA polymerase sigma-32 factor
MATSKGRGGSKTRAARSSRVIDVGDARPGADSDEDDPATDGASQGDGDDAEPADTDSDGDDPGDDLIANAAQVIDIDPDDDEAAGELGLDADPSEADDGETRAPARRRKRPRAARPSRGGSLAKRDPLAAYMQETRRYPLLTPEEEHALAVKLHEHGDTAAARRMVEANLRLVVKIAYEYRRAHRNLLDLVQEGNIGLMQAVRKFDPYRGVKLSSYAAFWIRAYILKFILNNWRLVKIGTTQAQRKLFFNLRKEKERLEQLGFEPSTALLAEKLDVSEKDVIDMERRLAAPEASLDQPFGSDDDGSRTRLDYIPSETARPDQAVAQGEFSQLLRQKLETFAATLAGREQTIFRERWLTEAPLTLQEIGDRYNISRERARQLEKRLLTRLRKFLETELGTAVDIDALARE